MKANNLETGANVKKSGLFSGAGHMEDGRVVSQSLSPGKTGAHDTKLISTSQWKQRFLQGGRGEKNKKYQGNGVKNSLPGLAQSFR